METILHNGPFGSCCKDLKDAMTVPPNSFFFIEENDVLYLTIGYVQTEKGPGWFDHAVIFCPFCGKQLQTKEGIAKKTSDVLSFHRQSSTFSADRSLTL